MLIIIDGPDKVGKTTMIEKIRKQVPCFVLKSCHRPKGADITTLIRAYRKVLHFAIECKDGFNIIVDRYYMSELVYSVLRGRDRLNHGDINLKELEKLLVKFVPNHLYVYCMCDFETLVERHVSTPDEYLEIKHVQNIIKRYDKFYLKTELNKTIVNTLDDAQIQELISKIEV